MKITTTQPKKKAKKLVEDLNRHVSLHSLMHWKLSGSA